MGFFPSFEVSLSTGSLELPARTRDFIPLPVWFSLFFAELTMLLAQRKKVMLLSHMLSCYVLQRKNL